MNLATVFDGELPASLDPGNAPGEYVAVWTPPATTKGQYQVVISAPDEPGEPFSTTSDFILDGTIVTGGLGNGTVTNEFQEEGIYPGPLRLATTLGHAVRVVVKVGLVAGPGISSEGGVIVSLDELKRALGIALEDGSEDVLLTELEQRAAAWVTEQLEKNFGQPAERVEYAEGNGQRQLWLRGHVQLLDVAPAEGYVTVRSRSRAGGDWQAFTGFELRGDSLIRTDGYRWSPAEEYELTYLDGYAVAPGDIKALVIELVSGARDYAGDGEGAIKSESIGDYSYTLDTAAAVAVSGLSSRGADTINRRRRKHI